MKFTDYLPFVSAFVMVFFTFFVLQRFFSRKKKSYHLLLWGIGLVFYMIGSFAEAYHTAFGWSALNFRLWYLCGAILVAAWLGQGTVQLLMRKRLFSVKLSLILLIILSVGSIYATYKIITAELEPIMLSEDIKSVEVADGFDEETVVNAAASTLLSTAVEDDGEISERRFSPLTGTLVEEAEALSGEVVPAESPVVSQMPFMTASVDRQAVRLESEGTDLLVYIDDVLAGTITTTVGGELHGHAIVTGGTRVLTPFFNMYGLFTLVGGAIYSAWIFFRKRIMPNRVIGNVLIATGALMPGIGGFLNRLGLGSYLYIGELLGAILMFAGFIAATTVPESAPAPEVKVAAAVGDK